MAPRKKVKKPGANPARGFATTSTVSKSKAADEDEATVPEAAPIKDVADSVSALAPLTSTSSDPATKDISELTPEQLEAQLEEDDLQNLLDVHRERCHRDVSRLISRLQTERRLLRSSSEHLGLNKWLSEDTRESIMGLITARAPPKAVLDMLGQEQKLMQLSEDELTIRIWTLKRALSGLGFMTDKSLLAVINLLEDRSTFLKAQLGQTKDVMWGLDECIEWLALNCPRDELPGYDSHVTPLQQKLSEAQAQQFDQNEEKRKANARLLVANQARANGETTDKRAKESAEDLQSGEETHSSDSDIEPRYQLGKYLQFKTRLHKRRPDLTEVVQPRGKKTKAVRKPSPKPVDSRSSKLLRRIRALERDLLFDKEEAAQRWAELRIRLVADEARERQDQKVEVKESNSEVSTTVENVATRSEEDESIGFGEFFASLPEPLGDSTAASKALSTSTLDGSKLLIRDFGSPAGMSPRRVFEEACKARDPGSKAIYTSISALSFSHRHELLVTWPKHRQQHGKIELDLNGIEYSSSVRSFRASMNSIACPDSSQSEAYISVAALFLIFSSAPKEEKAYLRLPAVWRELWSEFEGLEKKQLDTADRNELRDIRKMIDKHYMSVAPQQISHLQVPPANAESNDKHPHETRSQKYIPTSDGITEWQSRASSPTYQSMLRHRMNLPIWEYKDELMQVIDEHQVIILCGETGCGKSTQLPAYLLEHNLSRSRPCTIYCTEPRRISALSLARRVSEELGERKHDVGTSRSLVGYAIRMESRVTPHTKLVYATTGIVMRMLERGNELQGISHVVLDEVHERNIDSDFLLIVLRRLMVKRPDLKVILMSATVDAEQFAAYFGGIPIIDIPGRTHPVETRFLEDAIEETGYGPDKAPNAHNSQQVDEGSDGEFEDAMLLRNTEDLAISYSIGTRNALKQYNEYRIDYELIIRLLETVASKPKFAQYSKAILVFLPGMGEIRRLHDILNGHRTFHDKWRIVPLHSAISTEEQEQAFVIPPPGIRKIVLSTNIAETGVTIPDITCVIDTGKHKEMRFDERRQLSRLIEAFISRANAKQRRGRAGRVQAGLCFHLFTKERHDRVLPEAQTPEMLRLSLQDLALRIKICKLGDIEDTLNEALSPPLSKNIRRAVDSLIEVRALTGDQSLTVLGRRLAMLPLDVYLGKLILLSSVFNCLDVGLTIAAALSSKSLFVAPINARSQADQARLSFKKGDSDLITMYNAYSVWRKTCQTSESSEFHFCRKNFLNSHALSNTEELKAQLAMALVDSGFLSLGPDGLASLNRVRSSTRQRYFVELPSSTNTNSWNTDIVDSVIAWSFYPKVLIREGNSFRNVANNQNVGIHPTSVNKGVKGLPRFLSYYQIMQASSKAYHAQETSIVDDFAVALGCGEADFKPYAGVMAIDSNRIRFAVSDWKSMLLLKALRESVRNMISSTMRQWNEDRAEDDQAWFDLIQDIFKRHGEVKKYHPST